MQRQSRKQAKQARRDALYISLKDQQMRRDDDIISLLHIRYPYCHIVDDFKPLFPELSSEEKGAINRSFERKKEKDDKEYKEYFNYCYQVAQTDYAGGYYFFLGQCFEEGKGTQKDMRQAVKWYLIAATKARDPSAIARLKSLATDKKDMAGLRSLVEEQDNKMGKKVISLLHVSALESESKAKEELRRAFLNYTLADESKEPKMAILLKEEPPEFSLVDCVIGETLSNNKPSTVVTHDDHVIAKVAADSHYPSADSVPVPQASDQRQVLDESVSSISQIIEQSKASLSHSEPSAKAEEKNENLNSEILSDQYAQNELGQMLYDGDVFVKAEAAPAKWFEKANSSVLRFFGPPNAGQQQPTALADIFTKERGCNQNQAEVQLTFAALRGDAEAQFTLGLMFEEGVGRDINKGDAMEWHRKAALQGHPKAQYNLALCLEESAPFVNGKDWFKKCLEMQKEAVFWYKTAAQQGDARAQYDFARCLEYGIGTAQDKKEAVEWYERSAEQGHREAQYNLAMCFELEIGTARDEEQAIHWHKLAAAQGHKDSQDSLAQLVRYEQEVESKQKPTQIKKTSIVKQGHENAQNIRAQLTAPEQFQQKQPACIDKKASVLTYSGVLMSSPLPQQTSKTTPLPHPLLRRHEAKDAKKIEPNARRSRF